MRSQMPRLIYLLVLLTLFCGFVSAGADQAPFTPVTSDEKSGLLSCEKSLYDGGKCTGRATYIMNSNAFLQYTVGDNLRFTLATTGGDPSTPADNNQLLLYGFPTPGTSYTTIRVEGSNAIYGSTPGIILSPPTNSSSASISSWQYNDVRVTQTISLVQNPSTGRADVMKISYLVKNTNASRSRLVGVRVMLDTMLGYNDAAPFRIPGDGEVTYEQQYTKAAHTTPQYWQAFDSLTTPTVMAQGTFIGGAATEPSKSQFTHWRNVYDTPWEYVTNPSSSNGDSAVSLTWYEVTLAPGQSKEYVTYYGLGSMTGAGNDDIALQLTGPAQLSVVQNAYSPNPFTIVAYVENKNETRDLTNVRATLNLPAGLVNKTPLSQNIAAIPRGETRQVSWQVTAKNQYAKRNLTYQVTASGSKIKSQTAKRSIILPALSTNPLIFSIAPASGVVGTSNIKVTITGDNFYPNTTFTLKQGTASLPLTKKTYISATKMTVNVSIPAGTKNGAWNLTVRNFNGKTTQATGIFTVQNPVPVITTISPATRVHGTTGFTLTVTGNKFVPGSKVRWNGVVKSTVYVSPTQLQATIPAADIATAGSRAVTVINAAPGGGVSNSKPFTVT